MGISILSTAMHCEPDSIPIYPIAELENVKAYVTVSPVKETYRRGDTIKCTLRVEQKDWNNWVNFDKAVYSEFRLYNCDGDNSGFLDPIKELSKIPMSSTKLPDGDSYIEQITYYILAEAKTYVLGTHYWDPHLKLYQNFQYWNITYEDVRNDKWYSAGVPIHIKNNEKRFIEIRVEE